MGPVGLWRTAIRRSAADVPIVAVTWLLLLSAITLLVAGVIYGDVSALAGLRRGILAAPATARTVVVGTSTTVASLDVVDRVIRDDLTAALQPAPGPIDVVLRADGLAPRGTPATVVDRMTELASFDTLQEHAQLMSGRWPAPGMPVTEATLSEGAARALGISVGDEVPLTGRGDPVWSVSLRVVGIWRPRADDAYWLESTLDLHGIEQQGPFVTRGPFAVERSDLTRIAATRQLSAEWRAGLDVGAVTADTVETIRAAVAGVGARIAATLPATQPVQVRTSLPDILASISQSILVGRSGVLLLTIQFGILAGYAIVLVAGIVFERHRPEMALLRARGASSGHLALLALGEALLVAVPAAALAPFLAAAAIRSLDTVGPIAGSGIVRDARPDTAAFLVGGLAAVVCVLALTLPPLGREANPTQARAGSARQTGRTLGARLGIDVALVVLAAIAIWQLRLYGGPLTRDIRGTLGLDPLLVAAPGIGLLAGAVAGTRLFPWLADGAERLLARRRGLVGALGARNLARRPLRSTRSALLLMLAAALGTFAAVYASTWRQSQEDQVAYAVPSDVRLIAAYHADLPSWALGSAYRSVTGVAAAAPVGQRPLEAGRAFRDGQLLALDATAVGRLVSPAADGSTGDPAALVSSLVAGRPQTAAVPLPGSPTRLALTLDADLHGDARGTAADPGTIVIAVVLMGPDGLERIEAQGASPNGVGQIVTIPLTATVGGRAVAPTGPLSLEAIEITVAPYGDVIGGVTTTGTFAIRGVAVGFDDAAATGPAWTPVPFNPGAAGWGWDIRTGSEVVPFDPGAAPGRVTIGRGKGDAVPVTGREGSGSTFRLWAEPDRTAPEPAVVGESLLGATGATVGDTIAVTSEGEPLALRVMAATDAFPPLDPERPFAIVDRLTFQLDRFARSGTIDPPDEWWLALEGTAPPDVAATLRGEPYSAASVLDRAATVTERTTDPVPLGLIGALALGSVAALAIAGIGFVVSATESSTERVPEFAILRALGVSARALARWLAVESSALLAFGLLLGCALGLLLAWLVLPFATLTPTGAAPVPAPVIVVPALSVLPLLGLGVVLLVLSAIAAARQVPAVGLGRLLRGEDI